MKSNAVQLSRYLYWLSFDFQLKTFWCNLPLKIIIHYVINQPLTTCSSSPKLLVASSHFFQVDDMLVMCEEKIFQLISLVKAVICVDHMVKLCIQEFSLSSLTSILNMGS